MHFIEEAAYIVCRSVLPDNSKDNQAYENFIKWCATNDVFDIFPFLSSRARKFFMLATVALA
jgi:hypothetical protein